MNLPVFFSISKSKGWLNSATKYLNDWRVYDAERNAALKKWQTYFVVPWRAFCRTHIILWVWSCWLSLAVAWVFTVGVWATAIYLGLTVLMVMLAILGGLGTSGGSVRSYSSATTAPAVPYPAPPTPETVPPTEPPPSQLVYTASTGSYPAASPYSTPTSGYSPSSSSSYPASPGYQPTINGEQLRQFQSTVSSFAYSQIKPSPSVQVSGYYKQNGTYVPSYARLPPGGVQAQMDAQSKAEAIGALAAVAVVVADAGVQGYQHWSYERAREKAREEKEKASSSNSKSGPDSSASKSWWPWAGQK